MKANSAFTEENGVIKSRMLSDVEFIRHGFTTRSGGVSEGAFSCCNLGLNTADSAENVIENYRLAAERIGFKPERLVLTQQVHGDKIKIVTENDCTKGLFLKNSILNTDGLITNCKNVPIGIFTADCTPILLCDKVKKVIAAVHSGWRGTLLEIGKKAALLMRREFYCNPEDVIAVIGPSIKKCHFEVKEDVYMEFYKKFGADIVESVTEKKADRYYIDTDTINRKSLVSAGILNSNISICGCCTFCESEKFFSHRASGGKTGRQCAFISIL